MKLEIPRENQKKIIITFIIVAILITSMVLIAKVYYLKSNMTDAERLYEEYGNIPVDNVFKLITAEEAYETLDDEKAILLFGFKECKWCRSYIPILNEVITENNVPVVYYCNIKEDRMKNTEEYKKLVGALSEYLYEDDNKNKRIYVPDVYFIKDGKIIGHNNDTSIIEGADTEEYYTEEAKSILKDKLTKLTLEVYPKTEACDDSKGC
ncbi:MAG: hypothetical protein IKL68_00650 [Clostridia bacterium]|nr:hypothetical protein [Clostridia bacterium]